MQTDERRGLMLAICGFALLSVGDAVVKTMAGAWSPVAVAALRFSIGAAGLCILLYRREGPAGFRPRNPLLQLARGFCVAGATICFFSAIFVLPLATAMALTFVAPIFVALLSGPLLGEKVRPAVWLVSPAALIGVVLILRPNLTTLGPVALLPLGSALFFALMVLANRASAGQGSALSMQAFIALGATPFLVAAAAIGHVSGAPMLAVGTPDWTVAARCAIVAVTASSAHWLVYLGTERAGAATIAPSTYVQMVVATVLGYLLFSDVPDALTLAGAAIIIGAGLVLWWRTPGSAPIDD
ncbi:DMT family transporter [Qipengyuania sp. MTN3-11]|uniref:DMT family transporter n=1 Tax=Qipengyuania sp. MTN3-11 TaxID=3056557 RepID=UPI0036F2C159